MQKLRAYIESIFENRAFLRPLFYSYPGGLRFELGQGGSAVDEFLAAMDRAAIICADIFPTDKNFVGCLRFWTPPSRFTCRNVLRELRCAGIEVPAKRCVWLEPPGPDDDLDSDGLWLTAAFEVPATQLRNFLWAACAAWSGVQPAPDCSVYLFNLERRVLVFLYDYRGMDIVGPNHEFLSALYSKHRALLLDSDREIMDETFSSAPRLRPR